LGGINIMAALSHLSRQAKAEAKAKAKKNKTLSRRSGILLSLK
jgi:hypothetical protein